MKNIFIPQQMYNSPIAISLNKVDIEKSLIVYQQQLILDKKPFQELLKQLFEYCEKEYTYQGENCTYFQFDFVDDDNLPSDEKIIFNTHVHIDKTCFTINILPFSSKEQIELKLNKRKARLEKEFLESELNMIDNENKVSKI